MNRIEILFRLSDTADNLESAGLFREAVVLTNVMKRMAEAPYDMIAIRDESSSSLDYNTAINEIKALYEEGVKNRSFNNTEISRIISEFNNELDNQIQNSYDDNLINKLKKTKLNFKLQTDRMYASYLDIYNTQKKAETSGKGQMTNLGNVQKDIYNYVKFFGLENAKDVNDFNARWKRMTDYYKTNKFLDVPNGPFVFDSPGMKEYLEKLYQQLKLKYIK
jgi:hypothetical protein